MERLTFRATKGDAYFLSANIKRRDKYTRHFGKVADKLAEYEDAEEQGLLLRLPCKVGDTVYTNMRAVGWYYRDKNKPYKAKIVFIGINGTDNFVNVVYENDNMLQFKFSDFGKTVFLTKAEAELALKKMEVENDNDKK